MDFYLNQVLQAFADMDADLLGELLDPDQVYQEVPLAVFVEELRELFGQFKKDGDEYLEVESGNCCGLACYPELIRTAYRFVGNHSRNYIDFRFITEPTEDGQDHLIKEICECHELRCHQPKDWYGTQYSIWVYDDQKPDFFLSPDELIHTEIALNAYAEMKAREFYPLAEIKPWMEKYRQTFDFIDENKMAYPGRYLRWTSFYNEFEIFRRDLRLFEKWEKTLLVEAYRNKLELPEEVLIEVILDAEKVLIDEQQEWIHYILSEEKGYRFFHYPTHYVGGAADLFSESWAWFKPRQEALVEKYFSLTDWEVDEFLQSLSVLDPEGRIKSLTFHLEVREKAKKRGEEIPFGLWEKKK
uniref:hypothetical protein n=1 Tax=Algoriphagus sp. TaxID=1872435 RepID=UPI002586436A|nr:hypothetical protein [Algoriphagus sp.]